MTENDNAKPETTAAISRGGCGLILGLMLCFGGVGTCISSFNSTQVIGDMQSAAPPTAENEPPSVTSEIVAIEELHREFQDLSADYSRLAEAGEAKSSSQEWSNSLSTLVRRCHQLNERTKNQPAKVKLTFGMGATHLNEAVISLAASKSDQAANQFRLSQESVADYFDR